MPPTSSLARATPRQRLRMQDSYLTSLQEVTNTTITSSSSTASPVAVEGGKEKKKVVVIGAGWGGLSAAYELAKRSEEYDVTLLEAGPSVGGLVAGWKTQGGKSIEAGVHGFWYCYRNVFNLVENELRLRPFTDWTPSAQYSPNGLEVTSPIFQDLPRLPTPLGTFLYTRFQRLPLADRASAFALLASLLDFDNSDEAWRRYDKMTARELFREKGVSDRLYREAFEPMLLVGLFAPGEQCSAAGALGMLYYFILAHQADFDVQWVRGTVGELIFTPWVEKIKALGATIETGKRVSDLIQDTATGKITGVKCGDETFPADAVISAVGINGIKSIVRASSVLSKRKMFTDMMNLRSIDVLAVRLYLDRKVDIPYKSNACFGFDKTTGWTFFDLTNLHDELADSPVTVLEADFYHADQLLPQSDAALVAKVKKYISQCVPAVAAAEITDSSVVRIPQGVTHFSPGAYQYMPGCHTVFPNFFMAGDWIVTRHGSFSQEKAFVTGLEAANAVMDELHGHGKGPERATILPIEADEPHIAVGRRLAKVSRTIQRQLLPFYDFKLR